MSKDEVQETLMDFLEWLGAEREMGLAHPGQTLPYVPTLQADLDVIEGLITEYMEENE